MLASRFLVLDVFGVGYFGGYGLRPYALQRQVVFSKLFLKFLFSNVVFKVFSKFWLPTLTLCTHANHLMNTSNVILTSNIPVWGTHLNLNFAVGPHLFTPGPKSSSDRSSSEFLRGKPRKRQCGKIAESCSKIRWAANDIGQSIEVRGTR